MQTEQSINQVQPQPDGLYHPTTEGDGLDVRGLDHPFLQFLYYAILFTIPFYRWRSIGPLKLDWLLVMLLVMLIVPCIAAHKRLPASMHSNIWPWFSVFYCVHLISSLVTIYPIGALKGMFLLTMNVAFMSINLMMITRRGFTHTVYYTAITCITANAFLATCGYFLKIQYFMTPVDGRGIGGTIHPNNAAMMGVFGLPLCFFWVIRAKTGFMRLLAMGCLLINILGIVSTESRSGFLVMTVVLGILFLHLNLRKVFHPRYLGLVVSFVAIGVLLAILLVPASFITRLQTLSKGTQADQSTARRSTYLRVGLESFLQSPIIGTGAYTFKQVWAASDESKWFKGEERAAHNTYVEIIVGGGILGFFFFMGMLWQVFRNYNVAVQVLKEKGQKDSVLVAKAYRVAFVGLMFYFFVKSGMDQKFYLLSVPLSQVALNFARKSESVEAEDEALLDQDLA